MDPSFFNQYVSCNSQELQEELASIAILQQYKKGDLILKMGSAQTHFLLLYTGIACAYVLQDDGTETVDYIMSKPAMPTMPTADLSAPSPDYVQALTNCTLITFEISEIQARSATNPELGSYINRYLTRAWLDHFKLEDMLRKATAHARYEWFLSEYPGVIDKIPHSRVASFLGMSPITLSRIRTGAK